MKGMKTRKLMRLRQPVPEELRDSILGLLRAKFYRDAEGRDEAKAFAQDRSRLLAWVVLWPADWLWQRGVTIHGEAYREIFNRVFLQAAAKMESKVKYRPAYLRQVIQSHFDHHGEEIYEEAKSMGRLTENLVAALGKCAKAAPDPVAQLAQAKRILEAPKRTKVAVKTVLKGQLNLFG